MSIKKSMTHKKVNKSITFIGCFNPNKKCVYISGYGDASIYFETSADELVNVIKSIAYLRGKAIKITLEPLKDNIYGKEKESKEGSKRPRKKQVRDSYY